ncbi:MAG: carboxy terminal-processing peptidase [Bacteroidetes bacterium]|nr:carboxy terminal-processing peptidase [Bacteroidota bacterium]
MNKKALFPLMLLIAVSVFFSFRMIADKKLQSNINGDSEIYIEPFIPDNQDITKSQAIQETIMQIIRDGHYSPKDIDDEFSKKVYTKFLEMTDFGKLFFLASDIQEFAQYENGIDEEIKSGTTVFYDVVTNRIKERMKEAEAYYDEALKNPFTFTENDDIELDGKKIQWCEDKEALKLRWLRSMKYRTLARLEELKEQQKKSTDKKEKEKTEAQLEVDSRENVRKSMASYFKRLNKINESDRFASYMNSICHVVDPHTDFFPPKDKQRFDEEMSGTFYGIGAVLQNDEGSCKIRSIVVGSPCWKEGHLKVGDVILKVAQLNEEPVDISGWEIDDIVSIIRGKDGTLVTLTVKHLDGNREDIVIKRGKVEREETFAKSAIIKQGDLNIGYIILPEFYADFQNADGRRCAIDIEKEIMKLKAEKVQGIVLDLRNNGGGSLSDVVDIGGMFIDRGPIVQVKSKFENAQVLSDRHAGVLYDGPLTILINQGSASASEILAAAMQDYKSAVILGSTSFGKGTVQRDFPLEDFFKGNKDLLPFGSIKLTLQKFYRINGGSTQLKGVTPDVTLPDLYELLDIGERRDSNSLAWDQIAKSEYKTIKTDVDFGQLIENSKKRVFTEQSFNVITKNAARLKQQSDNNRYSLNEKKYQEQIKEAKDLAKKMEEIEKNKKTLNAFNPKVDMASIQKDTTSIAKNTEWLKLIKKDPYINEASNVIADWIKLGTMNGMGAVMKSEKN